MRGRPGAGWVQPYASKPNMPTAELVAVSRQPQERRNTGSSRPRITHRRPTSISSFFIGRRLSPSNRSVQMDQSKDPARAQPILFISTGTVQMRSSMRSQSMATFFSRLGILRRLWSFTDGSWSAPLPVGAFLISHPDGPILFDTGESTCCNDPGFTPAWSPTKLLCKVSIAPGDGIVQQLRHHGVEPSSLQAIVLSHLHSDHAGGLRDLRAEAPHVPIYVSREHWEAVGRSHFQATLQGCNPRQLEGLQPRFFNFKDETVGPWRESAKITADGTVRVVATPGHVAGHVSLVVHSKNAKGDGTAVKYFLTGDATYGIDALDREEPDGIGEDPTQALRSLRLIKEFARRERVVVLPSHDPDTPRLLRDELVFLPKEDGHPA